MADDTIRTAAPSSHGSSPADAPKALGRSGALREHHSWGLTLGLFAVDAVLVLSFAAAGNRSHETGLSPADVLSTAWPFLVGLALSWCLTRSFLRPHSLWPQGVFTVVGTVALGMILRVAFTDGGVQVSFVMVATLVLSVLLLGRRLLSGIIARRARL
ncbi:DUF3054 domain-containing protein [Nesterenkonia flava]|uniref:DUF3054 domain-containing protein n=1 Tax=Nesterenkonia flava TaxID=469799 RepID=A0ABU1FRL2_9MICC|nr:DUF3054 domain-containing protein [Nesterenkonia flava]MDR5711285.1 DUF3054 domain-containing protein [Nesterenkonia flava]